MSLPAKRSRGRPRKNPVLSNFSGFNNVVTASQFSLQNKENENPSKNKSSALHLDNNTVKKALATKRLRGRPRKDSVESNAIENESFLQSSPSSSPNNENLTPTTIPQKHKCGSQPKTPIPSDIPLNNVVAPSSQPTNQSNVNNATITSTTSIDRIAMSGITQLPRSSDSITHKLIQPSSMNDGVAYSTPNLYTSQTALYVERTPVTNHNNSSTKSNICSNIEGVCINKGKSVLNEDVSLAFEAESDDEHGYIDRISRISKDYLDHGHPTIQCSKCRVMLWQAEANRGSNHVDTAEGFSLCCGRGKFSNGGSSSSNSQMDRPLTKELKTMLDRHNPLDEAPMVHRHCFEAFDRTLRDIAIGTYNNSTNKVIGGKDHCIVLKLTENMRLRVGCNPGDADSIKEFTKWILSIGDGKIGGKNDVHAEVEFP
uniref:ATP-dependent DNA helicase n=1 Tax=Tanacetum cinerariifolium TaxID=118510 RepID=A0A6L2NQR0_TANCI|nr:ATP-dependent DNA helicase PIF1-like [Tanacetum cinerariifolium]